MNDSAYDLSQDTITNLDKQKIISDVTAFAKATLARYHLNLKKKKLLDDVENELKKPYQNRDLETLLHKHQQLLVEEEGNIEALELDAKELLAELDRVSTHEQYKEIFKKEQHLLSKTHSFLSTFIRDLDHYRTRIEKERVVINADIHKYPGDIKKILEDAERLELKNVVALRHAMIHENDQDKEIYKRLRTLLGRVGPGSRIIRSFLQDSWGAPLSVIVVTLGGLSVGPKVATLLSLGTTISGVIFAVIIATVSILVIILFSFTLIELAFVNSPAEKELKEVVHELHEH